MYNITLHFQDGNSVYLVGQTDTPTEFVEQMAEYKGYSKLELEDAKNEYTSWNAINASNIPLKVKARLIKNSSPKTSLFLPVKGDAIYYL